MRVMSFVQVLILLTLLGFILLVTFENPDLVRVPLPLGWGEWLLPTGLTAALFTGLGMLYAVTLMLPLLIAEWRRSRKGRQQRHHLEQRLVETLGARLGAPASPETLSEGETATEVSGERAAKV